MNIKITVISSAKFLEAVQDLLPAPSRQSFRAVRKKHRISQTSLAEVSGYSASLISKFELQKRSLRADSHVDRDLWQALNMMVPKRVA